MFKRTTLVLVLAVSTLSLLTVSPVFAKDNDKDDVKARAQVRAEVDVQAEKAGSRPGLLRSFFEIRGKAAIGSGMVTEISGTTLKVKDKDGKVLTVVTNDKTQFRRKFWGKGSLSEISVGDMVNVIGKWTDDAKTTIQARLVRDVSIQKRFGIFFGVVQSLTTNGFVMQTEKRGSLTVTVSADTKIVNRREQMIVQSDIAVGHRVRAKGLWDSALSTLTQVTHIKDFSLPVRPITTITPTVTSTP